MGSKSTPRTFESAQEDRINRTNRAEPEINMAVKNRGGRPTAAQAEARAARLREIATELFLEFGYERTTLTEIAKRAGASKETLYSRYPSKAELFVAVISHELATAFKPFEAIMLEGRSVELSLKDFGFAVLTAIVAGNALLVQHLSVAESVRFPEIGRLFWVNGHEWGYGLLEGYMQKQIELGHLREADPDLMSRQFLDLLTSQVFMKSLLNVKRSMTATERRTQTEGAVDVFLRAYRP